MQLLLTPLLALLPSIAAKSTTTTPRRHLVGPGVGSGIFIPNDRYTEALNNPNATGHYPIDGLDLRKPYPSQQEDFTPISGWSIDINITADIPLTNISRFGSNQKNYLSGTYIRLTAPPSLITTLPNGSTTLLTDSPSNSNSNSTWTLCLTVIYNLPNRILSRASSDNGSCASLFGAQCNRDITNFDAGGGSGSSDPCQAPTKLPTSCEDHMWAGSVTSAVNLEAMDWTSAAMFQLTSSAPGHERGNATDYDVLGNPVGVMIGWGFNATSMGDRLGVGKGFKEPRTTMVCPVADRVVGGEGSRAPRVGPYEGNEFNFLDGLEGEGGDGEGEEEDRDDEDNTGGRVGPWAMWVVMVGVSVLWLVY